VQDLFDHDGAKAFESGKLKIFQQCIKGKHIRLETQLRVYDFCPSKFNAGDDWVVE